MLDDFLILFAILQEGFQVLFPGIRISFMAEPGQFLCHPFIQQLINILIVIIKRIMMDAAALHQHRHRDLIKGHFFQQFLKRLQNGILRQVSHLASSLRTGMM